MFSKLFSFFWFFLNILSILYFLLIYKNNTRTYLFSFIEINQISFLDNLFIISINDVNIFFIFTVSIISLFANLHTYIYMQNDQKKEKFICLLNGFAFSMINLVISKNLLLLFLFWELLGLTSFYLINHNDTQIQSQKSSFKAFTYNKFSDFCFIIGIILFAYNFNTLNVNIDVLIEYAIDYGEEETNFYIIKTALILIFLSSVIKSVQIITFFWLPDSMKAPAPASALIHSATLVAAGFYILIVFREFFSYFLGDNFFIWIGIVTSIFGAIIASSQYDLKKILAYSTIANCGFMLVLLYSIDMQTFLIYFVLHGLLKSVCFMLSGNLITIQNHEQDTRLFFRDNKISIYSIKMLTCLIFCLAGAPFSVMYLIKHSLIISFYQNFIWISYDAFLIFYGFFSLLYAFNFFYKSLYNIHNFKNNIMLYYPLNTQVSDLIYALFSLIFGIFLIIMYDFLNKINYNFILKLHANNNSYFDFILFFFCFNLTFKYILNKGLICNLSKIILNFINSLSILILLITCLCFSKPTVRKLYYLSLLFIILFIPGVIIVAYKLIKFIIKLIIFFIKK